jgi:hypothetical protein
MDLVPDLIVTMDLTIAEEHLKTISERTLQ